MPFYIVFCYFFLLLTLSDSSSLKGTGAPSQWKNTTSPIESLNFMKAGMHCLFSDVFCLSHHVALLNIENNELKLAQKNIELCLEDLAAVHYDSAHPKDVAVNLKPLR
jgi:hypothetical protein